MKRKKILFRTYGGKIKNKQTGLGHIIRSINLANELKKYAEIFFLVEDYGGAKRIIFEKNYENISSLPKNISVNEDIKKTIKNIKKNEIDLIIIDKHSTSQKYLDQIRNFTKTVIISDLLDVDKSTDLLINGYIGLENKKFKNTLNSLCLTGPKYQILNQKFSKLGISVQKKYDLLVTFGALDEKGMVDVFLDSLNQYAQQLKIRIILGPIASKSKKTLYFSKKFSKNISYIQYTKNMKKEILQSKFGLTAGGITSYEFASMKVPFGIICDAKHQIPTAIEWEKKEMAINLGMLDKKTPKKIQNMLKILTQKNQNPISSKTVLVDGKGVNRVSNEIIRLLEK